MEASQTTDWKVVVMKKFQMIDVSQLRKCADMQSSTKEVFEYGLRAGENRNIVTIGNAKLLSITEV